MRFSKKFNYKAPKRAVLDWFEKDIGAGFAAVRVPLKSEIDPGSGYLAGPLLGYQTNDGIWAVSFAAMVFSSFSQDWEGTAGSMKLGTDIETDRHDLDFAVTYSLSKYQEKFPLFKYSRIFVGYKYQTVGYDLTLNYDTMMGRRQFDYGLDAEVHMPTVGVGFVYPAFDKLVLGFQLGLGLTLTDLELKDPDGITFDISPAASFTYNGEFTLSFLPIKHLIIQLGFRAQVWYLKARSPLRWQETESEDITYGLTISVVYALQDFLSILKKRRES